MKTIIFDLDGTLANIDHRLPLLERAKNSGDKADWDAFYVASGLDSVYEWAKSLYMAMFMVGYKIVIVSGRNDVARKATEAWLREENFEYEELHLREEFNYEPDYKLKRKILEKLRREGHEILFAVDDRKQVVDMYRNNGVVVLQCAEGDF